MEEIIKSIKAFLYDRAVSPLFGAYLASWSFWNYRVFVILLDSNSKFEEKMAFMDAYFGVITYQLFGDIYFLWGAIIHGFLYPIGFTFAYLYWYPLLAKPVYSHSLAKQKELREIKNKNDMAQLLTAEQSRYLQKEIEQLRNKSEEEGQQYRERISSLTKTINELELSLNKIDPIKLEGSLVEAQETTLDIKEFKILISSKLNDLPDNFRFELSDVIGSDNWKKLSTTNRQTYGRLFNELVESGEFKNVTSIGKGSRNQLIFQKGKVELEPISDIEKMLQKYFEKNDITEPLLHKVSTYSLSNRLNVQQVEFMLTLVFVGGRYNKFQLKQKLTEFSDIEFKHIVTKLESLAYIYQSSNEILFHSKGEEWAVESGLTALIKLGNIKSTNEIN